MNDFFEGLRDFFGSDAWVVGRNLGIFFLVVFWLALAYWVFKDARRRIEDPWLIAMATILGLVPVAGALIYMLFRSTWRMCVSASSRSRRWRSGSRGESSTVPSVEPTSRTRSSSVRSARPSSARPA